jgi:hypothetical protein
MRNSAGRLCEGRHTATAVRLWTHEAGRKRRRRDDPAGDGAAQADAQPGYSFKQNRASPVHSGAQVDNVRKGFIEREGYMKLLAELPE